MDKPDKIEPLSALLRVAAESQLNDTRMSVIGFIKNKLQQRDVFQRQVDALEKELIGKRGTLAALDAEIEKMSKDDWSVVKLTQSKKENSNEQD